VCGGMGWEGKRKGLGRDVEGMEKVRGREGKGETWHNGIK